MTRHYHAGQKVIYAGQQWLVIGVDLFGPGEKLMLRSLATGVEVDGIDVRRVTFVVEAVKETGVQS